jgi:hypothetical protein
LPDEEGKGKEDKRTPKKSKFAVKYFGASKSKDEGRTIYLIMA